MFKDITASLLDQRLGGLQPGAADYVFGGDLTHRISVNDVGAQGQAGAERDGPRRLRAQSEVLVAEGKRLAYFVDGHNDEGQVVGIFAGIAHLDFAINAVVLQNRLTLPFQLQGGHSFNFKFTRGGGRRLGRIADEHREGQVSGSFGNTAQGSGPGIQVQSRRKFALFDTPGIRRRAALSGKSDGIRGVGDELRQSICDDGKWNGAGKLLRSFLLRPGDAGQEQNNQNV